MCFCVVRSCVCVLMRNVWPCEVKCGCNSLMLFLINHYWCPPTLCTHIMPLVTMGRSSGGAGVLSSTGDGHCQWLCYMRAQMAKQI